MIAGVAAAVAVLAGALLVGDSVRASLRDLVLSRLGRTEYVISSTGFFRQQLAGDLGLDAACPMITLTGVVTHQASGRRAYGVQIYGIDERFWKFHGMAGAELPLISPGLAQELASQPSDALLARVEKPSAIPRESLHGRKEDVGRTIRLAGYRVLPARDLGEFSLRPQQGPVRAIFLPLATLQRDLEQPFAVNTLLVNGARPRPVLAELLRERFALEDLGIRMRVLEGHDCLVLETTGAVISDALARAATIAAARMNVRTQPVLTYLANTIRSGDHEIPYSLVTATDDPAAPAQDDGTTPIMLNEWAARDLGVKPGAPVSLEYFVWKSDGRLETVSAQFQLAKILPIVGAAADRDLAPEYPGITTSESLHDWDPPFPIELSRVRPRDEDYWKRYRTTPKAFIPLAKGQELWGTRFGKLTSIRLFPAASDDLTEALYAYRQSLRSVLNPLEAGFTISAARADGLQAARGSTDFGEYFVYFSFFLMVSALLLAGLFFKLGIEQRLREVGTLAALGFAARDIRKLFLIEGAILSAAGCLAGAAAAIAYGKLMLLGLRTIWSGAVGVTSLVLHPDLQVLALGSLGGIVAAVACILWTLRGLQRVTSRGLILGSSTAKPVHGARIPLAMAVGGAALIAASAARALDQTAGFFGAGTLLLAAALWYGWIRLSRGSLGALDNVRQLGLRNAAWKPGRSILCVALIASATFVVVAVDAFRVDTGSSLAKQGPSGGFALMAESLLPIIHDPNTAAGREALNLSQPELRGVHFVPFRLRPGDDASCLNLYQPRDPRVLAVPGDFIREGRFAFQESLAKTAAERANPWLLLNAAPNDGVVPAIADANSMTYVLHRKLGDEITIGNVRLRLVAALADSVFQGELLISESNFLRVFPDQQGFRYFLLEADRKQAQAVSGDLESDLADFGFDVTATRERLASFHRVENTYIATFQALGGLGLLLGTVGLAAVLLRNVLERRRELALLRAVGYRQGNLIAMVLAENALLLIAGLAIGMVCALLAIAPALASRGGGFSVMSIAGLLLAVLVTGMAASLAATIAVARLPVLASLRSE